MDEFVWRKAVPGDAAACIALRGKTRENAFTDAQLRDLGIPVDSWGDGIRDGLFPGHVCCANARMVGYCFGDTASRRCFPAARPILHRARTGSTGISAGHRPAGWMKRAMKS
jgi:hypothetical protein